MINSERLGKIWGLNPRNQISLDIHGVIDTNPKFFAELTSTLLLAGWQVHVVTGSRLGDGKVKNWLDYNGIYYTHLFSISDSLKAAGVKELEHSTDENPWFANEDWNTAKAEYCKKHSIEMHLDDNDEYFEHFKTPIGRFYSKGFKNDSR